MAKNPPDPRQPRHESAERPSPATGGGVCESEDGEEWSAVESGDLVLVPADHDVALQLQARGELTALLGPVLGEDGEGADRLGARQGAVGVADGALALRPRVGIADGPRTPAVLPTGSRPVGEGLLVDRHQRRDERAPVTDDQA